ncbi:MAG TPA: gamma-glutamyl-gamma-aminobutyrate hydrolase family protein [Rhizomicrobium sp.]|jgi:putative glutamine amidotransferase|nr:gamma-glutamyl-gamma-aminobutyrate hydrolase family protein [Rhizomicrobium sp.]
MAVVGPVVGIVTDRRLYDGMAVHQANDEYIAAIQGGAGALPLLIPSSDTPLDSAALLQAVAGLLFTGSASNVDPVHYGAAARPGTQLDPLRDATSLPLLRAAILRGVPVLAICRGFQELNVALGGSLHSHVHELPGHLDHREPKGVSVEQEYALAHAITITPESLLARLGGLAEAKVNSLHHQGIDRLAAGLRADAHAPDGLVEAVSMPTAPGFVLGVQWHPEWRWEKDPLSRAIFAGFGRALSGMFTRP